MRLPEQLNTQSGEPRRAGFEFEFAGMEPGEACEAVTAVLGGTIHQHNPFDYEVRDTPYGKAGVELDAAVLKEQRYLQALDAVGISVASETLDNMENALLSLSATLVPCEIVLPPIPLTELDVLEDLREELRLRQAKGTKASLAYAFGLHINTEPPDLDVGTLTAYLRAFVLLHDLIRKRGQVDLTRSISPYINRYPAPYERLLAAPDYAPASVELLVRDYLEHNPTRNRPLDMLPLFAHLRERDVQSGVRDSEAGLVKARPAFHFRLPNCRIDEAGWTVASEWEHWLLVEELAADAERLNRLGEAFLETPGFPGALFSESWAERCETLLHE